MNPCPVRTRVEKVNIMGETVVEIDNKKVILYRNTMRDVPVVYANMYQEAGRAVIKQCEKLGCKPFHLVSISNLRWEEELSPWAHKPVVSKNNHFTGEAKRYAHCMAEKIIPFVEEQIKVPYRIIAGYSMGGLFALYAPYIMNLFSGVIAASASVWYSEFVSYVKAHDFLKKPDVVYLSLGDLESRTRNQFLSRTEQCMEELYTFYQENEIDTIFEQNPGNHFKNVDYRLAKGITWMLESKSV